LPDLLPASTRVDDLVRRASTSGRPVVLIDGRSGSGKTTLGRAVAARLPGAQLVELDDVYPGWHGLAAASEAVATSILRAQDPGYRRWDWTRSVASDWRSLDPLSPLVVEGAGALTPASAELATLRVWLDLDDDLRKHRALTRDAGGDYDRWWDAWAAQEDEHLRRHSPRALADLVIVGDER
jgi:uridine kinase